jgi:hypothetical protein
MVDGMGRPDPAAAPATNSSDDWPAVARAVVLEGWARLPGFADEAVRAALTAAAPANWEVLPPAVASVRQGGMTSGATFDDVATVVRQFAFPVYDQLTAALPAGLPDLPRFNEVTWARSHDGAHFISAHRDPPGVGGVIAIVTLRGRALFQVLGRSGPAQWVTGDGDLVLLRGNGWPEIGVACAIHSVDSPTVGDRLTMTLRFDRHGPGGDYFAP